MWFCFIELEKVLMTDRLQSPAPLSYASAAPGPRRPVVWPSYVLTFALLAGVIAMGVFLGIGLFAYAAMTGGRASAMVRFQELMASTWVLLVMLGMTMVMNAAGLGICLYFSRTPLRERLALYRGRISAAGYVVFALGAASISILCGLLISWLAIPSPTLDSITGMVQGASPLQLVLSFVLISVVGPVLEELIFRGYIQTRLVQRHGPLLGILIASLFFGIFHMDVMQGGFAVLLGLFLGTLTHRARSLYPAIVCHVAVNALSTVATAAGVGEADHWVALSIASGALLPVSLFFLYRMRGEPAVALAEEPVPLENRLTVDGVPLG
jgi:membrane protease YdiL (CAAX protease family)